MVRMISLSTDYWSLNYSQICRDKVAFDRIYLERCILWEIKFESHCHRNRTSNRKDDIDSRNKADGSIRGRSRERGIWELISVRSWVYRYHEILVTYCTTDRRIGQWD